jgi:hypothetical protein
MQEERCSEKRQVAARERIAPHCYSINAGARRPAIVKEEDGCH